MTNRLIRLPEVMYRLGLTATPDRAEARRRYTTFYRRYRFNLDFPQPVRTPDGTLAWREREIDVYLDGLGRQSLNEHQDVCGGKHAA